MVEDLSVKNLTRRTKPKTDIENGNLVYLSNGQSAKSGLNKSMLDAAHGQFANVLKYVAWKLGKSVLFVDPKGTSQHCWNCLNKVPKELSKRWHSCQCGESLDRDKNSAKLIRKIGLSYKSGGGTPSLKKAFEKKAFYSEVVPPPLANRVPEYFQVIKGYKRIIIVGFRTSTQRFFPSRGRNLFGVLRAALRLIPSKYTEGLPG